MTPSIFTLSTVDVFVDDSPGCATEAAKRFFRQVQPSVLASHDEEPPRMLTTTVQAEDVEEPLPDNLVVTLAVILVVQGEEVFGSLEPCCGLKARALPVVSH
jgi:hypothetical protein